MIIQSMTGYGAATVVQGDTTYLIEIKSVNSKSFDLRLKLPSKITDKEFAIRKIVQDAANRGRIEITISGEGEHGAEEATFNKALFIKYFKEIKSATDELGLENPDIFTAVMRIPSVLNTGSGSDNEELWNKIQIGLQQALDHFNAFRNNEGAALALDLEMRAKNISACLPKLSIIEQGRVEKVKDRLRKNLDEFFNSEKIDQNRFEQELIYYLERIDITEEKTRLTQHIIHFLEQLRGSDVQVGKLLNFISQEIGREINTIGSKAQDADMQQLVVYMKDELEKIKEQLANIL